MKFANHVILLGSALGLLVACGTSQATTLPTVRPTLDMTHLPHNVVEMDIFSGQPNPTWSLSDPELTTFITAVNDLPVVQPVLAPEHLGYRGFNVHLDQGGNKTTYHIYNGFIRISSSNEISFRRDYTNTIELRLLETGRPYISSEIYEMVRNTIQ